MKDESFSPEVSKRKPPMTLNNFSEGVNGSKLFSDLIAFDIETFSPNGFPYNAEDPVVNFSIVAPLVKNGILSLSVIGEPSIEDSMLFWLHELLRNFKGAYLLTYNGAKFDVKYVLQRGRMYNLNFEDVFTNLWHIDVYRMLKWLNIKLPKYNQKFVEKCLGIRRVIHYVTGRSYHLLYREFLENGTLTPMFYNIEDSFGCLRIANAILRLLNRKEKR